MKRVEPHPLFLMSACLLLSGIVLGAEDMSPEAEWEADWAWWYPAVNKHIPVPKRTTPKSGNALDGVFDLEQGVFDLEQGLLEPERNSGSSMASGRKPVPMATTPEPGNALDGVFDLEQGVFEPPEKSRSGIAPKEPGNMRKADSGVDGPPRPARVPANPPVHPLALTALDATHDLADVVLARTRALVGHLAGRADMTAATAALEVLQDEAARVPRTDAAVRKRLYLKACAVRRQAMLSHPRLSFEKILFARTHFPQLNTYSLDGGHLQEIRPGSGILVLEGWRNGLPRSTDLLAGRILANGRLAGKAIAGSGCFTDPDLDWDGRRLLFAWNEKPRPWKYYGEEFNRNAFTEDNARQLFLFDLAAGVLRHLTEGIFHHYSPCWLPGGRIACMAERDPGTNRCRWGAMGGERLDVMFARGYLPYSSARLCSLATDGTDLRRHSHHDATEWTPSVDNNGMIVYGRWDYIDRPIDLQSFWTQYPDGRDPRSPHGNYPLATLKGAPHATPAGSTYMRAIPGTRSQYVLVSSNHRIFEWGSLLHLDTSLPDLGTGDQVREITPDLDYPFNGDDGGPGYFAPVYSTPWPLDDHLFLVAFRRHLPAECEGKKVRSLQHIPYVKRPKFGLYLLDIFGNRELIHRDGAMDCLDPIPLAPRPRPPVLPDLVRDVAGNGPQEPASIAVMNVYESDFAWPKDTRITALRIVQVFQNYGGGDDPPMGFSGMALPRMALGTAPVYPDGSAWFQAPINRMLYFQALDEQGRAVQSMRSATSVQAGERLSCVGCHENKWKTPPAPTGTPMAFRRGQPDPITPEAIGAEPFTFARHIQPILTAKCAACHVKEKKGPQRLGDTTLVECPGGRNKKVQASAAYADLRPYAFFYAMGGGYGIENNRSVAGQVGARAAKLLKCLGSEHHGVQLTANERRRFILWLDLLSPYYCSIFDRDKQHAGDLVMPRYDFDPRNFFGLDRPAGPKQPLSRLDQTAPASNGRPQETERGNPSIGEERKP